MSRAHGLSAFRANIEPIRRTVRNGGAVPAWRRAGYSVFGEAPVLIARFRIMDRVKGAGNR